jgi:hypothetical protein
MKKSKKDKKPKKPAEKTAGLVKCKCGQYIKPGYSHCA